MNRVDYRALIVAIALALAIVAIAVTLAIVYNLPVPR